MPVDIELVLRRLRDSKKVAVDCETSGLDWRKNFICGYVLTFGPRDEDSYYLPVRHPTGNCLEISRPATAEAWDGSVHEVEKEIVRTLDQQDKHLIFHNGAFDLKFLYRVGFTKFDAKFEDTQINAVLLNELEKSFSLDWQCKVWGVAQKKTTIYDYIGEKVPEAKGQSKNAMAHFWRLAGNDPVAVDYAAGDGVSTWQLCEKQHIELELQNLMLVHSIESKLIPVLAKMMIRGVKIDEERLHWVKGEVERRRDEALRKLPDGFNSRAPSQVRKLMEEGGFLNWPMTPPSKTFPNGVPSFNEAWLLTNPVGQNIIAVRKYENLVNSFIQPMIDTHMWKGRVHTEFHQLRNDSFGTITGRLSSSNPNAQQISKRNKELGGLHRSIFVPDEGMIWGSADMSQAEPRILAYYSRCKVLLEGYRATPPIDAHQAVANATGLDRDLGKRINQTLITGGGKKVLVAKYSVPADRVDEIWASYFEKMPEIKDFSKQAANRLRQRGYVISLLGRRCRLQDRTKDYVALNRLLQTGNADCLKYVMVELDQYYQSEGGSVNLLLNCHDALETQFFEKDRKVYEEGLRIMTDFGPDRAIHLDVPMAVDAKEGHNWSEATYGVLGV